VATKVVVVVENQDPRFRLPLQEEVRGRKTAEASSDNNQIVDLGVEAPNGSPIAPTHARELAETLRRELGFKLSQPRPGALAIE
jgi:hypothetical protein